MVEDSISFSNQLQYYTNNSWNVVWPDHILPIFGLVFLFIFLIKALPFVFKGLGAFNIPAKKEGQEAPSFYALEIGKFFLNALIKTVATAVVVAILWVGILTGVQYLDHEDVTQHHPLWKEQVLDFPLMLKGVFFGPDSVLNPADTLPAVFVELDSLGNPIIPDSSLANVNPPATTPTPDVGEEINDGDPGWFWYSFGIFYILMLTLVVGSYVKKKKYKTASIIAISGLMLATFFKAYILPPDWASSFGFYGMLIGFGLVAHWYWRHLVIDKPQPWNIDPEAPEDQRGPQKHWFGLWGNALFHLNLLLIFGPFGLIMVKANIVPLFVPLSILIFYALVIIKNVWENTSILDTIKDLGKDLWDWVATDSWIGKILGVVPVILVAIALTIGMIALAIGFLILGVVPVILVAIALTIGMVVLGVCFLVLKPIKKADVIERGITNTWNWALRSFNKWLNRPGIVRRMNSTWNWALRSFNKWSDRPIAGIIERVICILIALTVLISILLVKVPAIALAVLALPLTFMIGGIYSPHIRGRIVPMFFKYMIFSRFWLLGKEYLDKGGLKLTLGGLKLTLLPSWLWSFNMYLIDYSVWEIEDIKTSKIPTKAKRGQAGGVIIDILFKITLQVFYPKTYLEMREEDRSPSKIRDVIIRYVLDAARDLTQMLTYEQIKSDKIYQYPVRYKDVHNLPADDKLRKKYNKLALLQIKVSEDKPERGLYYVRTDEDGLYVPATFVEYLDWLLVTLTGCRVVELGVLDATSEVMEAQEEALKKSDLAIRIEENMGKAAGARYAAEIGAITALFNSADSVQNQLAIDKLTALIGAKEAGLVFRVFQGLGKTLNSTTSN